MFSLSEKKKKKNPERAGGEVNREGKKLNLRLSATHLHCICSQLDVRGGKRRALCGQCD